MSPPSRNQSLLDIVSSYNSGAAPQPSLPRRVSSSSIDGSSPKDKEHFGQIVDSADPALSHLDHAYSYSFMSLSLKECRALMSRFRQADPDNIGLTQEQFADVAGTFLASKTTSHPTAIFAMFDTGSTKRVTLREFLCGYAILCKGTTGRLLRYWPFWLFFFWSLSTVFLTELIKSFS